MKLYDFPLAPNPRRLRVFLAEKGIAVPKETVNLVEGAQRSEAFLAKNPLGGLPVLELDDGTILTESGAIIEYFEELHPEPTLLGTTPLERAQARRLDRIVELGILRFAAQYFHASMAVLPGSEKDVTVAESAKEAMVRALDVVEAELGDGPWLAGGRVTVGDCTLFAAFEMARFASLEIETVGGAHPNLARWYGAFKERPSAGA
jgi:glutathione S-transferase